MCSVDRTLGSEAILAKFESWLYILVVLPLMGYYLNILYLSTLIGKTGIIVVSTS